MKKQIKTKMLSLALIAGVAATAGALALNHSAKQAAAESSGVFQMENTVRLRLNGDGLAFSVKMDGTKYNEIKDDKNKSLYFIVMPSMYLGNVKTADGYDYAAAIARDGNGDYNYKDSHCLYVNASEAIYQSGEDYYALGGVSDVLEANRKLDYVAVACVETKSESGFTYEYAALPEGKEQMPTVSQYTTLSKSVLYSTTDYSAQIAQHYAWFGKGEYALTIATTEDYNALVGKINGGADLADMELRINSGVDKQATLNEGMTLPAKQVTYSTVKFYDDDGKTLLSSADVNDGESVTPITPEKAATEEYTYTFEKWVTEKDGDVAASFKNITANMSVYAKYTAVKNKITITWKKNAADEGITEIYNRGETPQYKGETLKNYFDGDKYYICKGFENIVPAEEDTTYVCSWEEHAGKEITLSSWFGSYLYTDISIPTVTEDKVDPEIIFKGISTKTGGEVNFNVAPFYANGKSVLVFQVNYSGSEGEVITFNDSTVIYNNQCLNIVDGTSLMYKNSKWYTVEDIAITGGWFGNFMYTDIEKGELTSSADEKLTFSAIASVNGNVSFQVLAHHPDGKEVVAFRIDYGTSEDSSHSYVLTEGEIITFSNSIVAYRGRMIRLNMQLIYKNGAWAVYNG